METSIVTLIDECRSREDPKVVVTSCILLAWIVLYSVSDEKRHIGSFFGNAIADWSGVVVMVLATKHLYERGSKESREPQNKLSNRFLKRCGNIH